MLLPNVMIGENGTEEWQEILIEGGGQSYGLTKSSGLNLFPEGGLRSLDLDTLFNHSDNEVMRASFTVWLAGSRLSDWIHYFEST